MTYLSAEKQVAPERCRGISALCPPQQGVDDAMYQLQKGADDTEFQEARGAYEAKTLYQIKLSTSADPWMEKSKHLHKKPKNLE